MSTNARYEFHVSKVADKLASPTVKDDYVFRFEALAPDATGAQQITLTVLKDGTEVGSHKGASTAFAASKANTITTNTGNAAGSISSGSSASAPTRSTSTWVRFFQVRAFLADRFFGAADGDGNAERDARGQLPRRQVPSGSSAGAGPRPPTATTSTCSTRPAARPTSPRT